MDYISFWFNCITRAFDFSKGVIEVAGFLFVLIVGFGGWAFVKRRWPGVLERLEKAGLRDETSRNVLLFVILFFGYVIAIGPYALFQEKQSELEKMKRPWVGVDRISMVYSNGFARFTSKLGNDSDLPLAVGHIAEPILATTQPTNYFPTQNPQTKLYYLNLGLPIRHAQGQITRV